MSRRKENTVFENLCKWFNLWGEVTNRILPSLLLNFEYMGQKKTYVKGGFCGLGGGGTQLSFEK